MLRFSKKSIRKIPLNVLRICAILLVIKFYCPFAHYYLVPLTVDKIATLVIVTVIIFFKDYLLRIQNWMMPSFGLLFLLLLFIWAGHYPLDSRITYFIGLIFIIFLLDLFLYLKDYRGLYLVSIATFLLFFIISITTIYGLDKHPWASRLLAGSLTVYKTESEALRLTGLYKSMGIGGHIYIHSSVLLFPIVVWFSKKRWKKGKRIISLFYIVFAILLYYTIIKSSYAIALIFASLTGIIALFYKAKTPKVIYLLTLFLFFIIIIYSDLLFILANLFEINSPLYLRIHELYSAIQSDIEGGLAYRLTLYKKSIAAFIENPLTGSGQNAQIGGHALWLDLLGVYGLFVILPVFTLFYQRFRYILKSVKTDDGFILLVVFLSFIGLGFVKSMAPVPLIYMVLFIVPAVLLSRTFFEEERLNET